MPEFPAACSPGSPNSSIPDAFVFPVSILYVTMGILGGIGSLAGAALGGLMLTVLPELLRGAAEYKDFLTGLLLLLLLIFLPKGVVGAVGLGFGSFFEGWMRGAIPIKGTPDVRASPGGLRGQVGDADLPPPPPFESVRRDWPRCRWRSGCGRA